MASTNKRGGLLLCDPVGTGKTVCALTALLLDVQQVGKIRPTLIVCPGNLTKSVWLVSRDNDAVSGSKETLLKKCDHAVRRNRPRTISQRI